MRFARWMAMPFGRLLRIVVGAGLVLFGSWVFGGVAGWVLAAVGVLPILAGFFNVCLIAPLIGAPFRGSDASKGEPPASKPMTPAGSH